MAISWPTGAVKLISQHVGDEQLGRRARLIQN
jgi:hypothetical protein